MRTIIILLSALLMISGCDQSVSRGSGKSQNVCGGYTKQRDVTEDELTMFRLAIENHTDAVYTPLSVATQVVAGLNYKFWCRYEPAEGSKAGDSKVSHCWVIIFKPLPGQGDPVVTSIELEL